MRFAIPAIVTALLITLLGTTGCSGSGDRGGSSRSATAPALASALERGIRWAQCMRHHAVAVPDPIMNGDSVRLQGAPKNVDAAVLSRAQRSCQALRPIPDAGQLAQKVTIVRRYAACMRRHGVAEYPDPDGAGQLRIAPAVHADPQYAAATTACDEVLRSARPSS
jgi:hypothetical protein